MNRRSVFAIAIGSLMAGVVVDPALAGLVTWAFTGEITSVFDRNNLLGGAVTVGSPFSGSFTFESTTEPTEPGGGFYDDALTSIAGEVGDSVFIGPADMHNSISILNDFQSAGFDHYGILIGVDFLGEPATFGSSGISGMVGWYRRQGHPRLS